MPGYSDDPQSRYLEAAVDGHLIACLYAPNGNPAPGPKFDYKLKWLACLVERAKFLIDSGAPALLVGDFNIIPSELDVYKPERWTDDALFRSEVRDVFAKLLAQGWIDSLRKLHPEPHVYTFWDYFRKAFDRDAGLRIDHLLLSPAAAKRLKAAGVDRQVRGWEHSSDHAPTWVELSEVKARTRARRGT